MPAAAQVLVVQAAIVEPGGIAYADAAGTVDGVATTVGILQQDPSYGSPADRVDGAKADAGFLARLRDVPCWECLQPTIAIHRVQRNADPQHYAKYRDQALAVVQALAGSTASLGTCGGTTAGAGDDLPCGHSRVFGSLSRTHPGNLSGTHLGVLGVSAAI